MSAEVVFECPGSVISYEYAEDYSSGNGANHVVATSSGQGTTRPQSSPARDEALLAAGWPRYEYRWSPSTSITDTATLDAHAKQALSILRLGARTFSLVARTSVAPKLGQEWEQGDDIAASLTSPRHPDGYDTTARCIGWEMDPEADTVTPVLVEQTVPTEEDANA